mgnify:CR=1 FL=1
MKQIALLVSKDNPFYREFFELQKPLNYKVTAVIADHYKSDALLYATEQLVDHYTVEWHKGRETEEEYISRVNELVNTLEVDLLFATDWKHLSLTTTHPFYYVELSTTNTVTLYNCYNDTKTELLRFENQSDQTLFYELRSRLLSVMSNILLNQYQTTEETIMTTEPYPFTLVKHGKVRDCYDVGYGVLAMVHTDNQSAFDRHICTIPQKGALLTATAANWFMKLHTIGIQTHYLSHYSNVMFVKRCQMLPVEMVIRGYITGSTSTSLWTHYERGERNYCGINFEDNLKKNQHLLSSVITPTTKQGADQPISGEQVVERGLMTLDQFDHCSYITHQVFAFGQFVASQQGLILADTKYEFGIDDNGTILLCDEVHTCDSSRFWHSSSYMERFLAGEEPEKFDKDIVRDYVRERCDPYNEPLPKIPDSLISQAERVYINFYQILFNTPFEYHEPLPLHDLVAQYFTTFHYEQVTIYGESTKQIEEIKEIQKELTSLNIYSTIYFCSGYKEPTKLVKMIEGQPRRITVNITVSNGSDSLPSICSHNSPYPTICYSTEKATHNLTDAPYMIVGSPTAIALAAKRILRCHTV